MDDRTTGLVLKALRVRRGWSQDDLAARVGCSQGLVSAVEAGHLEGTTIRRLRELFAAVDGRLDLAPRWRGAGMDRLLDAAHAAVVAEVARRLEAAAWTPILEATYSEFGERGSIDVLGVNPGRRAALVVEVKTQIGSAEAIGRKLDEKGRLAPKIVHDRIGWRPVAVGRVLVMPDSAQARRVLAATPALARMLPSDARAIRRWLRQPVGAIAGTWFLSNIRASNARRVRRVRRPVDAPALSVHQGREERSNRPGAPGNRLGSRPLISERSDGDSRRGDQPV